MVRRPKEWGNWTQEERMEWLRKQRRGFKGGRKRSLEDKDKERVWSLMKKCGNNKSMVADLLGVSRRTVSARDILKTIRCPKLSFHKNQ